MIRCGLILDSMACNCIYYAIALCMFIAGFTLRAQDVKERPSDYGITGVQPTVYWHDRDVDIDIEETKGLNIIIHPHESDAIRVPLPDEVIQVDLVHRANENRFVYLGSLSAEQRLPE